ncbi:MAG: hypothetical protein AAGA69_11490, partial [Pseudomonadota bacterium]
MMNISTRMLAGVAALAVMAGCESVREHWETENSAPLIVSSDAAELKPGALVTSEDLLIAEEASIPAGQLPEGVTPMAYELDLRTDPSAPRFSGSVRITVKLDEPATRIYLHSLGPDISSAMAVYEGDIAVPATFEGDLAQGGVSRLNF